MGKVFKKYLKERIIDFIAYISEYMYGIISYLLIVGGMAIILNKVSLGPSRVILIIHITYAKIWYNTVITYIFINILFPNETLFNMIAIPPTISK